MAQIRNLEQSRQVLTPEQREKLRTLLSERMQHRGPHGPGMRGITPPKTAVRSPPPPRDRPHRRLDDQQLTGVRSYIPTMSECKT